MQLLHTIVAFAVALGALIVVHELGHFWAARFCGVKVLRFSVGFGRVLLRRTGADGTEWAISAFPLGGYVKMLDEREGPVEPAELPRAFNRQSVWRRVIIVAAGPLANFLLAIALYWLLFVAGIPGVRPVVGAVTPGSPVAQAGIAPGDVLTRVGGEAVATWQDARWQLLKHAVTRQAVALDVERPGAPVAQRQLDFSGLASEQIEGDFLRAAGFASLQPPLAPVVGSVASGGAGAAAGLLAGDRILAIEGRVITRWDEVVSMVRDSPGRELRIDLERARGDRQTLAVVPQIVAENGRSIGRIGVAPRIDELEWRGYRVEVRYGVVAGLWRALERTWDTTLLSVKMLGKMVIGEVSVKNLSGPITIADYAGQSAQVGWVSYLLFLALISISLGVLNLLPIPLLDGGHLMYYIVEIFKGSPVSERAMEVGQQVGMAVLFTLMAFALYNDINRLISG